VFPGTYPEFLWSKEQRAKQASQPTAIAPTAKKPAAAPGREARKNAEPPRDAAAAHEARKRAQSEQRKRDADSKKRDARIAELETRIAEREQAMKELEAAMAAPGFYENRDQAQPVIDRHQSLMWELGDLMHQWEDLQR
jgi:uncharacterized coiled-coil protein SlyX